MKVAYLVNQYPHVSHSFIRREIAALEKLGIDVARFSVRPSPADLVDPADQEEAKKTHVILSAGAVGLMTALVRGFLSHPGCFFKAFLAAIRLGRRSERGLLRHFIYLAEACVLQKAVRNAGAEHLHAHFGTNSATVALLTRYLGGPPFSMTVHGPEEFDHPEALSLPEKIERSAFTVAISSYGRSQLCRWCSYSDWSKINVVHCGVDAAFLAGGPQPFPEGRRLVCVGRLAEQKGQLLLIDALGELHREGVDFEMVLAGDGGMRSVIEARIAAHGLQGKVRITGWVSNSRVREEIIAARAMVLPSFAEGLPVVLMESLALGRPALTTYVAGIPELVTPREGWLAPAGSVPDLAAALREVLMAGTEQLREMGVRGAARVADRHDIDKEAAKLNALFEGRQTKVESRSRRNG